MILDDGARSELARKGRYRFDCRAQRRAPGQAADRFTARWAQITGEAEVPAVLTRDALTAEVSFVVSVEKRPEIRKVFPPRGGASAAAAVRPGARSAGFRPTRSRATREPG